MVNLMTILKVAEGLGETSNAAAVHLCANIGASTRERGEEVLKFYLCKKNKMAVRDGGKSQPSRWSRRLILCTPPTPVLMMCSEPDCVSGPHKRPS